MQKGDLYHSMKGKPDLTCMFLSTHVLHRSVPRFAQFKRWLFGWSVINLNLHETGPRARARAPTQQKLLKVFLWNEKENVRWNVTLPWMTLQVICHLMSVKLCEKKWTLTLQLICQLVTKLGCLQHCVFQDSISLPMPCWWNIACTGVYQTAVP